MIFSPRWTCDLAGRSHDAGLQACLTYSRTLPWSAVRRNLGRRAARRHRNRFVSGGTCRLKPS